MWIVYKESEHGEHKAIEVSGQYTSDQISETVGHVNWYGSSKSNAEDAIHEAITDGFKYRSAEHMKNLNAQVQELQEQSTYILRNPLSRLRESVRFTGVELPPLEEIAAKWAAVAQELDEQSPEAQKQRQQLLEQGIEAMEMHLWGNLIDSPPPE